MRSYTRTIKLILQYDGTDYAGWQRQKNKPTIQEHLEKALSSVANEKVTCFGASRTDAGVHAKAQLVSFSLTKSQTPTRAFRDGTNALLPPDIRVVRTLDEKIDFQAIRCAGTKLYRYYFWQNRVEDVFHRRYSWQIRFPLDRTKMEKASRVLLGKHDFSCFQTHGQETPSSIRTVLRIDMKKAKGSLFYFELEADGFLRHMVRSIVGTLVHVGSGKIQPNDVEKILRSRDRKAAGPTAPANGLFLWKVNIKP